MESLGALAIDAVEVTIRPAASEDLKLLASWNSAVDRVVAPTLARQERGEALVLLAMLGPWPCGHLLVDFTKRVGADAVVLWHAAVHDSVRNRGIGSRLIEVAEREGRQRGLKFSELGVEKANPDALRLYRRLGYEIVGENDEVWPEADENGMLRDVAHPCWEMRKALLPDVKPGSDAPAGLNASPPGTCSAIPVGRLSLLVSATTAGGRHARRRAQ